MVKFHPIISILLGILSFFVFTTFIVIISLFAFKSTWFMPILLFIGIPLGGFIATYFAKDKKIRYGLYEGLLLAILTSFLKKSLFTLSSYNS